MYNIIKVSRTWKEKEVLDINELLEKDKASEPRKEHWEGHCVVSGRGMTIHIQEIDYICSNTENNFIFGLNCNG